jgi:hypothetical protein
MVHEPIVWQTYRPGSSLRREAGTAIAVITSALFEIQYYCMTYRQSTCQCTITVQFTDLEKLLLHRKHGNGADYFPVQTDSYTYLWGVVAQL